MTIITGGLFPHGVFILGDSRGVYLSEKGEVHDYVDDVEKIFLIGDSIIGIAGSARFGTKMIYILSELLSMLAKDVPNSEIKYLKYSIPYWLNCIYKELVKKYRSRPNVAFMLGLINDGKSRNCKPVLPVENKCADPIKTFGDTRSFIKYTTKRRTFNEIGMLISMKFPESSLHYMDCYGLFSLGSGSYFDNEMRKVNTILTRDFDCDKIDCLRKILPNNKDLFIDVIGEDDDICEFFTSIGVRVKAVCKLINDIKFNECLHGYAIDSNGAIFARWIEGFKLSKDNYKFRSKGYQIKQIKKMGIDIPISRMDYIFEKIYKGNNSYEKEEILKMFYGIGSFWLINPTDEKIYRFTDSSTTRGNNNLII